MLGQAAKCKVLCRAGRRNPRLKQDENREMVTDIETVSAAGHVLPPYIIYKGRSHLMGWHAEVKGDEDAQVRFAYSPKGWTDDVLGLDYLENHFYPLVMSIIDPNYPIFFILDGHASHFSWEFLSFCLEHGMLVLCLPPHSTHLLQPLDVGLFGPLQHAYSEEVDAWTRDRYDVIRKGNFWPMLKKARQCAFTKQNILSGWEATGIYPHNYRRPLSKIQHLEVNKFLSPKRPVSAHSLSTPHTVKALKRRTIRFLQRLPDASQSEIKKSFLKVTSAALGAMTEVDIEREINNRLRRLNVPVKTKDRRRLTKIRVITGADVEKLRLAKEAKAKKQKKTAKNTTQKGKQKAGEAQKPRRQPLRPKKQVRIASESPEEWSDSEESDSSHSVISIWSDTIVLDTPQLPVRRQLFPTSPEPTTPSRAPSQRASRSRK